MKDPSVPPVTCLKAPGSADRSMALRQSGRSTKSSTVRVRQLLLPDNMKHVCVRWRPLQPLLTCRQLKKSHQPFPNLCRTDMHEHEHCEPSVLNHVTWQLKPLKLSDVSFVINDKAGSVRFHISSVRYDENRSLCPLTLRCFVCRQMRAKQQMCQISFHQPSHLCVLSL